MEEFEQLSVSERDKGRPGLEYNRISLHLR